MSRELDRETARLIKLRDLAGFHEKDGEKASVVLVEEGNADDYFIIKRFLSGTTEILATVCGRSGRIMTRPDKQSFAFIDRYIDGLNRHMESTLEVSKVFLTR